MDDMTAKERFIFLFKIYLKQSKADVEKWTEHLERLEGKKDAVVDVPCNEGLCALKILSNEWREGAEAAIAPPQDENDVPNYDIHETLLNCADELDMLIEDMST